MVPVILPSCVSCLPARLLLVILGGQTKPLLPPSLPESSISWQVGSCPLSFPFLPGSPGTGSFPSLSSSQYLNIKSSLWALFSSTKSVSASDLLGAPRWHLCRFFAPESVSGPALRLHMSIMGQGLGEPWNKYSCPCHPRSPGTHARGQGLEAGRGTGHLDLPWEAAGIGKWCKQGASRGWLNLSDFREMLISGMEAEGPLIVDSCWLHPQPGSGRPVEWEVCSGRDSRGEGEKTSHVSGRISW